MRRAATTLLGLLALGACQSRPETADALPARSAPLDEFEEFWSQLAGWQLSDSDKLCFGTRPPAGHPACAWPREHGWVASGIAARAPEYDALRLVLREARSRTDLVAGELAAGDSAIFVLLVHVPDLDRCALLRSRGAQWELAASADIPLAARAKGFAASPVEELRTGGWIMHEVRSYRPLKNARNGRSESLWIWSGNGPGTEQLADGKDAIVRGESPRGVHVLADPVDIDPWFRSHPLADWPWPVWALTAEYPPGPK